LIDRRDFLGSTLLTLGAAALGSRSTQAAEGADGPLATTPLADGLTLVTGAGANVVAAKGPEGVVLVDGGLERRSRDLIKTALQTTGARKVQALFNTHWHPEQSGSNETLGREGVKIIAHKNTQLWLTRKITVSWRPGTYGPLSARALPNETTYMKGSVSLGEEQVDYGYLPQAHTDGDLYVLFRKANVLVGGGVVSGDRWPVVDYQTGGWIAGLIAGLDSLIKIADEHTKIVPADGAVLTVADLKAQRAAYFSIYDKLVKCLTKGLSPDEALATEPAKEINPAWGDSSAFVTQSFKSLWGHYAPDA
jgi:glyoxylase-like metal-dependent hydrolase (beta-lactamase superfamily II)